VNESLLGRFLFPVASAIHDFCCPLYKRSSLSHRFLRNHQRCVTRRRSVGGGRIGADHENQVHCAAAADKSPSPVRIPFN
jgi:hypothetical protein